MAHSTPVLYVLDENDEANGTVRYYCSLYCRTKALQTNEDPVGIGDEMPEEIISGTRCEYCGQLVQQEPESELEWIRRTGAH
jgi:hypothetical protein